MARVASTHTQHNDCLYYMKADFCAAATMSLTDKCRSLFTHFLYVVPR